MPQPTDPARDAALRLMTAVTAEGRLMSEALPDIMADLAPADRARAQRLAMLGLRWAQRADRMLGPFLRLKPEDEVMNAMRLALVEIHETGAAPYGAVNAAVSLVSKPKAGLVNAVLRNVLRSEADWSALPVPSLPKWLRKPLVAAWGKEAVANIERVQAEQPPVDLTPRDGDAASLAALVGGTETGTGSVRLTDPGQVSALPGYDEGRFWVQDAAAAMPARLLAVQPGERVIDLCAAPGGKTLQLAAAGAAVTAVELSDTRARRIAENLARTGLSAETVVADALTWDAPPADAVLLDAPCSATGTLRRHPDLGFAKADWDLDKLTALQDALFDKAVTLLKPGGRLVFCTCSLLPVEGEERLAAALSRHPDLVPVNDIPPDLDRSEWRAGPGALRTRPDHWADRGGIDGFFMATLVRRHGENGHDTSVKAR